MSDRLAEGRKVIERTYGRIWSDWFASVPGVARATLRLTHASARSGYRPEHNELHLNLPEANVEEAASESADHNSIPQEGAGWAAWKRELVHEMLHEYQYKALRGTSCAEGIELEARHRAGFDGPGHGADFFTAIAEKAAYFGVSAEGLTANL